jgi:hypothetical protein
MTKPKTSGLTPQETEVVGEMDNAYGILRDNLGPELAKKIRKMGPEKAREEYEFTKAFLAEKKNELGPSEFERQFNNDQYSFKFIDKAFQTLIEGKKQGLDVPKDLVSFMQQQPKSSAPTTTIGGPTKRDITQSR